MRTLIFAIITILIALAAPAFAEWPSTMEIGGFSVTDISGTTAADGSGSATGKLLIPSDGSCNVDLTRLASGTITGTTRSGFTVNGIRADGSFILDRNGLQGTGTVYTGGKAISDADMVMSARDGLSGTGNVRFSSDTSVRVKFSIKNSGMTVDGSFKREVTTDTPLATYTFNGNIEVSGVDKALKLTAKGVVERKGKVSGITDTFGPLTIDFDSSNGKGLINVGGSDVAIDLW